MKKIHIFTLFLTFFIILFFIIFYRINKNIEKDFFIKGHYLPKSVSTAPINNVVNINIHADNKIEIYSKNLNYVSYLNKYDTNIYTFKNNDEDKENIIFIKNEKLYLIFNKFDEIYTFVKVYEAPKKTKNDWLYEKAEIDHSTIKAEKTTSYNEPQGHFKDIDDILYVNIFDDLDIQKPKKKSRDYDWER